MNKLYYDDPLAAAYMSREFGVKIGMSWDKSGETYEIPWQEICRATEVINPIKHLVHPDSLHIFEPMVGDLVEMDGSRLDSEINPVELITRTRKDGILCYTKAVEHISFTLSDFIKIIQRNNLPFFTPLEGTE